MWGKKGDSGEGGAVIFLERRGQDGRRRRSDSSPEGLKRVQGPQLQRESLIHYREGV